MYCVNDAISPARAKLKSLEAKSSASGGSVDTDGVELLPVEGDGGEVMPFVEEECPACESDMITYLLTC